MSSSTTIAITRHNKPDVPDFASVSQANNVLGRPWKDESGHFSNFPYTRPGGYEIREHRAARIRQIISIDFFAGLTYILVGMLMAHERKQRFRDPERTRERLLQAAFREIHRSGFQSASIDAILAATNVTRGALYHHFKSKEALGYAVVEEKIAKLVRDRWLRPMRTEGEPIDILIAVVRRMPSGPQDVRAGCPLLLLSQEMSPLDEQFRKRLERIFLDWQEGVATLLRKGMYQGTVRRDLNPDETASFLIATVEGYVTLAKNAQDAKVWKAGIRNIVGWLDSLRAPRPSRAGRRQMSRISREPVVRRRRRL